MKAPRVETGLTARSLVSILFTVAILLGAVTVLSPFLLPILWAAIIATASWPLFEGVERRFPRSPTWTALLTTVLIGLILVGPMLVLVALVAKDVATMAAFFIRADTAGVPPPDWLERIPLAGAHLLQWWKDYLAAPDQLSGILRQVVSAKLTVLQSLAQTVLLDLSSRMATLFFALWVLFFFYRDGRRIVDQLNRIGYRWLEGRWPAYVLLVPDALRAAVNGLIIVGVAEAGVLAALLTACGVPSPVLLGLVLALIAFVPMAAPLALAVIGVLLFVSGSPVAGVALPTVGTLVVLLADYVVRPILIQGRTSLPFLAILFGIFGGILTMGIVGLIIGPVLLVLLAVFFREAAMDGAAPVSDTNHDQNQNTRGDGGWNP